MSCCREGAAVVVIGYAVGYEVGVTEPIGYKATGSF